MSQDDARFMQLVAMFQMAALQQMGKLLNPVTGEVDRDLQQAKGSIDLAEMLAVKTEGNLTTAEKEFLDKILFELRMNYVDEVNRPQEEGETGTEQDSEDSPEAATESDVPEEKEPETD